MYAPYSYYYEVYHGSQLTPDQWPAAAREAEAYIDLLTFGRLKNGAPVTDEVQMAVCAVAEVVGVAPPVPPAPMGLKASATTGTARAMLMTQPQAHSFRKINWQRRTCTSPGPARCGMRGCKYAGC